MRSNVMMNGSSRTRRAGLRPLTVALHRWIQLQPLPFENATPILRVKTEVVLDDFPTATKRGAASWPSPERLAIMISLSIL